MKNRTARKNGTKVVLAVGVLVLIATIPSRENPYETVIAEVSVDRGWKRDDIEVLQGVNNRFSVLNWTRVTLVVQAASSSESVYVTVRKLPFFRAAVSCYSVGVPGSCAT